MRASAAQPARRPTSKDRQRAELDGGPSQPQHQLGAGEAGAPLDLVLAEVRANVRRDGSRRRIPRCEQPHSGLSCGQWQ